MAKIYRVIVIIPPKLYQLVSENDQQSVFKRYHSDKHFSEFYLQDGGKTKLA